MSDVFQGDPRLFLDENGSELIFIGGQPISDQGLENKVLISLFTRPGWSGNILFDDIAQKIGSNFEQTALQPITLQSLNDVRDAAEKALIDPIFGKVTVIVTNPVSQKLIVEITIEPPGQDIKKLMLSKNGYNWVFQATYPAYRRA